MRIKCIAAALISLALLLPSTAICASAQTTEYIGEEIPYLYAIAKDPLSSLDISGNDAICTSSVSGTDTISITATQTLEKQNGSSWDTVRNATWTASISSSTLSMSNTKSGISSGTYRLKSEFTLTNRNGNTETVTVYSSTESH